MRKASSVFYNPPPKRFSLLECCPCSRETERRSLITIASLDIADDEYEIVVEKLCVFKVPLSITALPEDLEDRPMRFGMPPTSQEAFIYKEDMGGYEDYISANYHLPSGPGQNKLSSSMYPSYYAMVPKRQDTNCAEETSSSLRTKRTPVQKVEDRINQQGDPQETAAAARESNYQHLIAEPSTSRQSKVRIDHASSAPAGNLGPVPYYDSVQQKVSFHPNEKQSQSERRDDVNIPFSVPDRMSTYYAIVPTSDCEEQEIRQNDDRLFPEQPETTKGEKVVDLFAFSGSGLGTKQGDYRVYSVQTRTNLDSQPGTSRHVGKSNECLMYPLDSEAAKSGFLGNNHRDDIQHHDHENKQSGSDTYSNPRSIGPNSIYDAPAVTSRWVEEEQSRNKHQIPGPKHSAHTIKKPIGYSWSSSQKKSQDELSYYDVVPKKGMPQKKISKVSIKKLQQAKRYAAYYVSASGPSFKKVTSNMSKTQQSQPTTSLGMSSQDTVPCSEPSPQQSSATTKDEDSNRLPIHSTLSWLPTHSEVEFECSGNDMQSALSINQTSNSKTKLFGEESNAVNMTPTTNANLSSNTSNISDPRQNDAHDISLSQHLAYLGMRSLNMDQLIEGNQEKQSTFWDQFSSVLIEHNLNDPIPKDPNTFPREYQSINMERLADHISQFGSRQYSTKNQTTPIDNSPKRPRSADSDEISKAYSTNAKRRPSFNVIESFGNNIHSLENERSGYNGMVHIDTVTTRKQEAVAIRESLYSNEMGCAKLGDSIYCKTQLPCMDSVPISIAQSEKSPSQFQEGSRVEQVSNLSNMLPNSSVSVQSDTGNASKYLPQSLPELNDFLYYENLTKNSSTFESLTSDSNNFKTVSMKDDNSVAFLAQPSSAFVMSPISSNMFDSRSGHSSLPPQLGAQIKPVPSGCSEEISCLHLTGSEYNSNYEPKSAAQIESNENVSASLGRFIPLVFPSPRNIVTAITPTKAASSMCNSSASRPSSTGEYFHGLTNGQILSGESPSDQTSESTNQVSYTSERKENIGGLESYRQSGFLSLRKDSNSKNDVDEHIVTSSSVSPRSYDPRQETVSPRSPRRAEKSPSHVFVGDRSGVVGNAIQRNPGEPSSYDTMSLSPQARTLVHEPCSPSPNKRQSSPENQFRRNISFPSSHRTKAEEHSNTVPYQGPYSVTQENLEKDKQDRRNISFCTSLEPSSSQENEVEVNCLLGSEGAAKLNRISSPDNHLYTDFEPSECPIINDNQSKSELSQEMSQGTLLWTIMIKHRKHTETENSATEYMDMKPAAEDVKDQSCPLFIQDSSTDED